MPDESHTARVRSAYDAWSASYDAQDNPTRDLDGALVRAHPGPWGDVLEIGCGTGKNAAVLTPRARSYTGLDLSEAMLARARAAAPGARFVTGDVTGPWPFDDDAFDAVLADLVLEHVADLDHVARQAARVLRPGGLFRISEIHPYRQHRGGAAHFFRDGERVGTPTVAHDTADYVGSALRAGFTLRDLAEPRDPGAASDALPRLLVLELRI